MPGFVTSVHNKLEIGANLHANILKDDHRMLPPGVIGLNFAQTWKITAFFIQAQFVILTVLYMCQTIVSDNNKKPISTWCPWVRWSPCYGCDNGLRFRTRFCSCYRYLDDPADTSRDGLPFNMDFKDMFCFKGGSNSIRDEQSGNCPPCPPTPAPAPPVTTTKPIVLHSKLVFGYIIMACGAVVAAMILCCHVRRRQASGGGVHLQMVNQSHFPGHQASFTMNPTTYPLQSSSQVTYNVGYELRQPLHFTPSCPPQRAETDDNEDEPPPSYEQVTKMQ